MRIKLKDAFELQIGKTPSRNKSEYWNGVYKWVSISDIGNSRKYVYSTRESITDKGIIDSGIKVIPKGTVIMSFKLSIGKTAITTEDMYTNEAIVAFIDKKKIPIDIDYMYYLCSGSNWMQGVNKAVMGLTLNKATLSEKEINIPNIEIQKKCACNLDKIDRIIDLKKQQLDQLDLLARSLFIEMFGDLFTNPMNWNKQPLGAICNKVIRYPTFYGMEYLETGIKVIRIGNILADGRMDLDDKKYVFVDDIVNKDFPETIIDMNDIIMAVRGDGSAAKRIGIIREPQLVGANISPNLIRIKVDCNKLNPIYMFYYLTGEVGQKYLDVYVNKTAKKNIAAKDIVKVSIYVPPLDLQNRFADYVSSIDKSKYSSFLHLST